MLYENTGYEIKDGQKQALWDLYCGNDAILVACTGYGKTHVIVGYHATLDRKVDPITLVISPLKAIEQGQARDAFKTYHQLGVRPFVLDGENNTPDNRHDIARGRYTHVWLSAEIAVGEALEDPSKVFSKSSQLRTYITCI